jgi:hypothetical protein
VPRPCENAAVPTFGSDHRMRSRRSARTSAPSTTRTAAATRPRGPASARGIRIRSTDDVARGRGEALSSKKTVGAVDLPNVAIGVGEGAGVAPFLVSGFDDDLGAGVLSATH